MTRRKFNRQQENNYIVNHAVDKILIQGDNKVINEAEAQENIESEHDENGLYILKICVLITRKKIQNDVSVHLKANSKIILY